MGIWALKLISTPDDLVATQCMRNARPDAYLGHRSNFGLSLCGLLERVLAEFAEFEMTGGSGQRVKACFLATSRRHDQFSNVARCAP